MTSEMRLGERAMFLILIGSLGNSGLTLSSSGGALCVVRNCVFMQGRVLLSIV